MAETKTSLRSGIGPKFRTACEWAKKLATPLGRQLFCVLVRELVSENYIVYVDGSTGSYAAVTYEIILEVLSGKGRSPD